MSGFVNTVEIVGDDALTDSIIQRNISGAFDDDQTIKIGVNAFRWCSGLTSVNLPSVVTIEDSAFAWCSGLKTVDLASVESIGGAFGWCYALATIIIRNPTKVCSLSGGFDANCPLGKGAGQIYAPTAFLDVYRSETNWSAYADQFLALEEWTDDGTVYGNLISYSVGYRLGGVKSSNMTGKIGNRYTTTLSSDTEIQTVSITMGGVDITAEVYNAETGEINIPLVTGNVIITASTGTGMPVDFELNGFDFVNEGRPTTLNGMTLEGFDYTETSGSDGQGNIVTSGKERIFAPSVALGTLNFAEGFTIAFKVSLPNISQSNKYMWQLKSGNSQFAVIYGFVSKTFELYDDMSLGVRAGSQIAINDTNEHIIAYTHDKSTMRCYLDGALVRSYAAVFDSSKLSNNLSMYILGSSNTRDCIAAKAANFAIWNLALTAEEVAALFT